MSKGFITGTNEELIKAYKESRDESYLKELIEANKGLINLLVSPYLTSIPNSELEDLTSESYIPMLRAIEDYDPEQGVAFSTLLKVYVRQHLNRLYNEATRKKRFTGTTPDSLDRLSEINKEGGTETDSTFEVECKDFTHLITVQAWMRSRILWIWLSCWGSSHRLERGLRLSLKTVKSRKCRDLTECRSFIIMIWRSWSILENRYMRQGWHERNRGNLST